MLSRNHSIYIGTFKSELLSLSWNSISLMCFTDKQLNLLLRRFSCSFQTNQRGLLRSRSSYSNGQSLIFNRRWIEHSHSVAISIIVVETIDSMSCDVSTTSIYELNLQVGCRETSRSFDNFVERRNLLQEYDVTL